MAREIRKSPAAEHDLIEIWLYTAAEWGSEQADSYLDAIEAALERLTQAPALGSDQSHIRPGYRRLAAGKHRIYYRVEGNRIDVMRVLHPRMGVPSELEE